MILQPHGAIAQAGGILWNDGGAHDYRRGASPLHPEANFVRDVDFCAPAFLLARAALLSQLDGFDHDCASGYEFVDLCLRIAGAGFRVVYDPSVMITLGDAAPTGGGPGEHFLSKHAVALGKRFAPSGPVQVFARHAGTEPRLTDPPCDGPARDGPARDGPAAYPVHRGYRAAAADRFRLRARERPDPGDGVPRQLGDGIPGERLRP